MGLSEARGRLVAVGGAEDKEGDCVILKEFVRLSKGARARVVVMTVATDHPEEVGREYRNVFRRLGGGRHGGGGRVGARRRGRARGA